MKAAIKLPLQCDATYVEAFLSVEESRKVYQQLINDFKIADQKLSVHLQQQTEDLKTYKIMLLDEELHAQNAFPEEIWGKTAVWSPELKQVREKVETFTGKQFATCVCIYYPNGNYGVGYHSDFAAFGDTTVIPSISLGEERRFLLKEKETQKAYEIMLQEGSMLVMGNHCQERYEHSLPTDARYQRGRINLTFRQYGF